MGSRPSVEELFGDYMGRRAGVIRALTTDADKFYALCDPDSFYKLCLIGHPNGTWEVSFPPLNLPLWFPHPDLGINKSRDSFLRDNWLLLVAGYSDSWLKSVASYFRRQLNARDRQLLLALIDDQQFVEDFLFKHFKLDLDDGNKYKRDPRPTVIDVFTDYKQRRNGIVRALTLDAEVFFAHCDPEKGNLCLCGHSDGTWEVNFPPEDVLAEIPKPTPGINFVRDGIPPSDWLSMVAFHSDAWLISVAFFIGSHFHVSERERLFTLINRLPTIHEDISTFLYNLDGWNESDIIIGIDFMGEDHDGCRKCSGIMSDENWIMCNKCGKWYHGICASITPSQAKKIEKYKCGFCRCKRRQEQR